MKILPKDIGGYQHIVYGPTQEGDVWVYRGTPMQFVNTTVDKDVVDAQAQYPSWHIYRIMPQPGHHQPEVVAKLRELGLEPTGNLRADDNDPAFGRPVSMPTTFVAPKTFLPQGDKERKDAPMFRGLLGYFPAALFGVAAHSLESDRKHNGVTDDAPYWARGKSTDHADTIVRHLTDAGGGFIDEADTEYHLRSAAWRSLALYQEWLEKYRGARPGVRSKGLAQPLISKEE